MFFISVGKSERDGFPDTVLSHFRQVSWHMTHFGVETHLQQKKRKLDICRCHHLEILFPYCTTEGFHLQEFPVIEQVIQLQTLTMRICQVYKEVPSLFAYSGNYFTHLHKNNWEGVQGSMNHHHWCSSLGGTGLSWRVLPLSRVQNLLETSEIRLKLETSVLVLVSQWKPGRPEFPTILSSPGVTALQGEAHIFKYSAAAQKLHGDDLLQWKPQYVREENMSIYLYREIVNEKLAAPAPAAACRGSGWWLELQGHGLPWQLGLPHPPPQLPWGPFRHCPSPAASSDLPEPAGAQIAAPQWRSVPLLVTEGLQNWNDLIIISGYSLEWFFLNRWSRYIPVNSLLRGLRMCLNQLTY